MNLVKTACLQYSLAESGIGGLAIGLALRRLPSSSLKSTLSGFVFEVMDSVVAQAARTRYRMGGTRQMPIVFRSPMGGGGTYSRITLR